MDAQLLRQFSATVEAIHAAALRPDAWTGVIHAIASLQRAHRALLFTPATAPQSGGFVMAHEIAEPVIAEWGLRFVEHDIWTTTAQSRGLVSDGAVLVGSELVPAVQFAQSVFYREFLSRQDIWHMCTGVVFDGQTPRLPPTVCSVYRGRQDADFDTTDRMVQGLLARHLSQALGAMLQLRDTEFRLATSLQALDRLHTAVLLLAQRGHVLFANRNAQALLGRKRGLALRSGHPLNDGLGWLQADDDRAQAALKEQIQTALTNDPLRPPHFAQGLLIPCPGTQHELIVQVTPFAEQEPLWGQMQPGALIFITDPQADPLLDSALLQRLYDISAAECRVAQELLRGQTLQETARKLHLSENTVKTHLQRLFSKTSTHRQPQLIRLLLGLTRAH